MDYHNGLPQYHVLVSKNIERYLIGIKINKRVIFLTCHYYIDRDEFPTNREKKQIPKT